MEILDIAGKTVKISPRSITVKGENGKTAGVVRNILHFRDLQTNKQMDFWKILRESGIWGDADLMENVIFSGGKMYFLHNLKPLELYERMFANDPAGWEYETKRYNERKSAAERIGKYCTVIPCYVQK